MHLIKKCFIFVKTRVETVSC